jgi:hypothetical protein
MTKQEIIEGLKTYNKWRRGDETIPQPNPTELGILIDQAIKELKKPKFTIEQILKAGEDGEINHFETKHICNILIKK